jgi:hypothetical protein
MLRLLISSAVALGVCGCVTRVQTVSSGEVESSQDVTSKSEPAASGREVLVKLSPCDAERQGQIKISVDKDGKPKFEMPKTEKLVRGTVAVGAEKVTIYLPAQGPYSLKSEKSHSFENTSTALVVDADGNGEFTQAEQWFASMPIRIGDAMFDVKEIDPGAKWILLAKSAAPLGGLVVGKPCPNFTFTSMDGKKVSLADYKGKALLLDVWSMT